MQSAGGPVIEALLDKGVVPVISPVAMGEEAEPLNVDSDRAAAFIAMGIRADAVIFLTDVKGFLMDGRVVERLTTEEARGLLPKTGFGMQKKILAGVEALEAGVGEAIIASGFGPESVAHVALNRMAEPNLRRACGTSADLRKAVTYSGGRVKV